MIQIQNTLVSLDLIERHFCCNLDVCKGECCIEGDAGAPISEEEYERLQEVWPKVLEYLTPGGRRVLEEQGPGYYDEEGDLVTSLVEGRECVFATYGDNGMCLCGLEKAYRDGKTDFCKPVSCHLYPVRLKELSGGMTAVNCHRWKICKAAEVLGRKRGVRAYEFLREPLERRFGKEWYEELSIVAGEWLKQNDSQERCGQ